ncbi:hypothetical protein X767_25740 [Mesorhizobium sp. LSJC264A00]|nr:hypothetical protein X767_25740 [Mesorhizobium sp. LSJC264A00]
MFFEHGLKACLAIAVKISRKPAELFARLFGRHGVDVEQHIVDTDSLGHFLGFELVGDRQHRRADAKRHDHHMHARRDDEVEALHQRHQLVRRVERSVHRHVAGDLRIELGNDGLRGLRIVMGIFRHTLTRGDEGHLLAKVPDKNCGDLADRIQIAAHAALTVADVVPVADRNSDAARRRRRLAGSETLADPVGIGQGEYGIGHHVALAEILHQVPDMGPRPFVAQQDERAAVKDRAELLAVVTFVERTEGLREEDRIFAKYGIEPELIEASFEIVVLDEIGSPCGDHHVRVGVDIETAPVAMAEKIA